MAFCTAVTCMDGRVQLPVNAYLRERFGADFVDTITEPGPNAVLAGAAMPEVSSRLSAGCEYLSSTTSRSG
jgi:hypothetical protein